jgi:hypothetical protein
MTTPQGKPSEQNELGTPSGLTVHLKGRIKGFEQFKSQKGDEYFRTMVVMPAKDAYSHPATFPILSERKLGKDDSDVNIACELRPSYNKHKETGKVYRGVNLWLVE